MNPWSWWLSLLDRRETGEPLALVRMGLAIAVLYSLLDQMAHGAIEPLWVDRRYGGMYGIAETDLLVWLGLEATPTVVWSMVAGIGLFAVLQLVGFGGRVTAFVLLQLCMATFLLNRHAGGSYDSLIHNGLWLCVLAPTTTTWSVDSLLREGAWSSDRPVPVWARALFAYQIVLCYWTTGLQKVSAHWVPGGDLAALYYILQQPSWHRFDQSYTAWVFPLTQLATLVTWLWEVTAPLWLAAVYWAETPGRGGWWRVWSNRLHLSWVFLGLGVTFHLLIFATMDVGPFGFASLAYYPALVGPTLWRRWTGRAT